MDDNISSSNVPSFSELRIVNADSSKITEEEIDLENIYNNGCSILSTSNCFKETIDHGENFDFDCSIFFLVQHTKIKQNKQFIFKNCPIISSLILSKYSQNNFSESVNDIVIEMPKVVTIDHLNLYNSFVQSPNNIKENNPDSILKILLISVYFLNDKLSNNIINSFILNKFSAANVFIFLKFGLIHLNNRKPNHFFNAIINAAKGFLAKNIDMLISCKKEDISFIDISIIEDILNNYLKNNKITKEICEFVCHQYNFPSRDLVILLEKLFNKNFEKNSIINFLHNSFPTITELRGANDLEITVDHNIKINIQISLEKNKSYAVSFKDGDNLYFIHSLVYLKENVPIVNFSQFSSFLIKKPNQNDKKNKLYLHLKIDYLFTGLFNYVLDNIKQYAETFIHFSRIKANLDFIKVIMKGMIRRQVNSTTILYIIMIYYDNSKPENPLCNINDLLENVNFREVTLEILSEFYLKYNHFEGIEQKFIGKVIQIFKENHLDKIMIHCSKKLKIKEKKIISKNAKIINLKVSKNDFEIINEQPVNKNTETSNDIKNLKKSQTYVRKKTKSNVNAINDECYKVKGISYLTTSMNTQGNENFKFPSKRNVHFSSNSVTKFLKDNNLDKQKSKFIKTYDN